MQIFKRLQEQYLALGPAIEPIGLHADAIKYCATWVRKASLHQINQIETNKRYLYLACFIVHQYQLRQDILADILLTCVQATQNAIIRVQKENVVKQSGLQTKAITLLSAARFSYKKLLEKIEAVAVHRELDDAEKIAQIKSLLDNYQNQTAEADLDKLEQITLENIDTQDYQIAESSLGYCA